MRAARIDSSARLSSDAILTRLFADPPRLVTTALVEDLQPLSIVGAGAADVKAATVMLRRFSDQRLTLTDAVGLHLMQTRRIQTC